MEAVLRQGLTMLTWSSVTLETFFQEADQILHIYRQLLRRVNICSLYKKSQYLTEIISRMLYFIFKNNLYLFLYVCTIHTNFIAF